MVIEWLKVIYKKVFFVDYNAFGKKGYYEMEQKI
jgi:hypothetical protein